MRATAIAAALVVASALFVAPPAGAASTAPPAPSAPAPDPSAASVWGYFRTPWAADGSVVETRSDGTRVILSAAEWAGRGSPPVSIAPVDYVRTSWSPTVYALVTWPDRADDRDVDLVSVPTPAQLRVAGSPRARVVGAIPTTRYSQYASGPRDLYAETPDGSVHLLTRDERRAAGSPQPERVIPGGYYRTAWTGAVFFVRPGGAREAVTRASYLAAGEPQVSITPTSFVRAPWSPHVYALVTWPHAPGDRTVDQVSRLSSAQYAAAGRPRVETRQRIPGDAFVKLTVGPTVYHRLGGILTPVTTAQWRTAGAPKVATVRPGAPLRIRDILIVNKSVGLPASYGNGLRPELRRAFAKMKADAAADGVRLSVVSGFRSYASQRSVFASKVRQHGRATAERRSARPGHSEHQTGLAIDVGAISQAWGSTKAGKWVARHGHEYGFIVRYPQGKERITGYRWEPWHLRHVGVGTATHLKKTGLTLEEYLGVPSRY